MSPLWTAEELKEAVNNSGAKPELVTSISECSTHLALKAGTKIVALIFYSGRIWVHPDWEVKFGRLISTLNEYIGATVATVS